MGLSSLVVESQLMIVLARREISCFAVITCLRNVSILMRVMVSSHELLMLVVVQAWPNCVIHYFLSSFLSGAVYGRGVNRVVG